MCIFILKTAHGFLIYHSFYSSVAIGLTHDAIKHNAKPTADFHDLL